MRFSSGITSERKVRWSRKAKTLSGSVTCASSPRARRKSESAIGVTYSWLKRTSVRTKSASPGATASTPRVPSAASRTAFLAMIFSTSVIGREGVVIAGGETVPAMRSRL